MEKADNKTALSGRAALFRKGWHFLERTQLSGTAACSVPIHAWELDPLESSDCNTAGGCQGTNQPDKARAQTRQWLLNCQLPPHNQKHLQLARCQIKVPPTNSGKGMRQDVTQRGISQPTHQANCETTTEVAILKIRILTI